MASLSDSAAACTRFAPAAGGWSELKWMGVGGTYRTVDLEEASVCRLLLRARIAWSAQMWAWAGGTNDM